MHKHSAQWILFVLCQMFAFCQMRNKSSFLRFLAFHRRKFNFLWKSFCQIAVGAVSTCFIYSSFENILLVVPVFCVLRTNGPSLGCGMAPEANNYSCDKLTSKNSSSLNCHCDILRTVLDYIFSLPSHNSIFKTSQKELPFRNLSISPSSFWSRYGIREKCCTPTTLSIFSRCWVYFTCFCIFFYEFEESFTKEVMAFEGGLPFLFLSAFFFWIFFDFSTKFALQETSGNDRNQAQKK